MEEPTLKDEVKKTNELIAKQNENIEKLFASGNYKAMRVKKLGRGKLKKGFVNYLYIRENGSAEGIQLPIDEMTTVYENAPRLASPDYILNLKGKPLVIQPSWSCKPFSPADNMDEAAKNKMLAVGYRLLTNRQEQGEIKPKKKMAGWLIFLIIAAVLVVGYLLLK